VRAGAELDVPVIAVHHASSELEAASLRGPQWLYTKRRRLAQARLREADAIMSATPVPGVRKLVPLRFGLDPAFEPPRRSSAAAASCTPAASRERGSST